MPGQITKAWLEAFRLRTLPLALSSVIMGTAIAIRTQDVDWIVFTLCFSTTIFLQILSNLANDYGDSQNGADHEGRTGPLRMVQAGFITANAMKKMMLFFVLLSLFSGISLLFYVFGTAKLLYLVTFLVLGILAIIAAIKYTAGSNPYGYAGLGDISVFLFFGCLGVMGTAYLHTQKLEWEIVLPSFSIGAFATAVLNVNNIRDIESDKIAGKKSIPVRIGEKKAKLYHLFLLLIGCSSMVVYMLLMESDKWYEWLFLIAFPLFSYNGAMIMKHHAEKLDPFLKQMALSTFFFTVLFFISAIIS